MSRRSYVPYVITGVAVLLVALALGKDRGDEASLINSASKLLLTIGLLVVVVASVLEFVGRAKNRS